MPEGGQRQKAGHKPNLAMKRKRERYRREHRLQDNKVRRILRMMLTASPEYTEVLRKRLAHWREWRPQLASRVVI